MRKGRPPSSTPDTPPTVHHARGPRGGAGTPPTVSRALGPKEGWPQSSRTAWGPPFRGAPPCPFCPLPGSHSSLWLLSFSPVPDALINDWYPSRPGARLPARAAMGGGQPVSEEDRAGQSLVLPLRSCITSLPGVGRWSVQSQPCGDFICILSIWEVWGHVC